MGSQHIIQPDLIDLPFNQPGTIALLHIFGASV